MIKDQEWIQEILMTIRGFGVSVDFKSDLTWNIGEHLICFIPAKSGFHSDESEAILIHEDLFHTRKKQLIQRLKSQLGLNKNRIHGRSTKVVEITKNEAKKFVDEYHLMGFGGGKLFLGLFWKNELIAVAIFSKTRLMKFEDPAYYSTELERFCSLGDTTVAGGLDKLISHFAKNYKTDDLITMVDLEWSQGKSYLKLGFEEVERTQPILFGVDKRDFSRRVILAKADLKKTEYLVTNRGNVKLRKWISKDNRLH